MSIARMLMGVQSGPAVNWDLSFANEPETLTTYSVSGVSNIGNFAVNSFISDVRGVFIKPDGTKLYIAGGSDIIVEFSLSVPFDVTTASFSDDFSVSAIQTVDPDDLFISQDGTRLYTVDGSESVYQYAMSTAWDLSTISYVRSYSAAATLPAAAMGVLFKSDGAKMYVASSVSVYEFSLSTPWDISTASFVTSLNTGIGTTIESIAATEDGSAIFAVDASGSGRKITMSTPWDLSTGSSSTVTFPSDVTGDSDGICFAKNGQILFIAFDATSGAGSIAQYPVATYDGFSVSSQEASPNGIFFRDNGTKMYIIGSSGDDVNEYTLSTAWDETTATFVTTFSVSGQTAAPTGVFFKSDGTKMYVSGGSIHQYSLSTPWSVATATHDRSTSISGQTSSPQEVFFSSDGLKMYVVATSNVYEYDLSTAWDIQFISFVQSFSVSSQETAATGIFFKDDGSKMYVCGSNSDRINEYELSTPWDISTASLSYRKYIEYVEPVVSSMFFRPDGLFFYIVGTSGDKVFKYSISA